MILKTTLWLSPIPKCMVGVNLLSHQNVYHINSLIHGLWVIVIRKSEEPFVSLQKYPFLSKYIFLQSIESSMKSNIAPLLMTSRVHMIFSISIFNPLVWLVTGWMDLWGLWSIFTITFYKLNHSVTTVSATTIPGKVSLLKTALGGWYAAT